MTCSAMCGCRWRTASTITMRGRPTMVRRGRPLAIANSLSSAAVPGTSTHRSSVLPAAAPRSPPNSGASNWVCGSGGRLSLESLPLPPGSRARSRGSRVCRRRGPTLGCTQRGFGVFRRKKHRCPRECALGALTVGTGMSAQLPGHAANHMLIGAFPMTSRARCFSTVAIPSRCLG